MIGLTLLYGQRAWPNAFTAKSLVARIDQRKSAMPFVIALSAYFMLGGIALTAVAALSVSLYFVLPQFMRPSGSFVLLQSTVAAFWLLGFSSVFFFGIRHMRQLKRERKYVILLGLDGICQRRPSSIKFGGKSLCGCSGAQCVAARLRV